MDNHDLCTLNECIVKVNTQSTQNSLVNYCTANFCIICGENLGEYNPRQYCRKTYCPYETILTEDKDKDKED